MKQPLYQLIYDELLAQITSGKLPPEAKIPTEKELSDAYHVSRITSKRALTELEQNGFIYRIQGRGSFVKGESPRTATKKILFVLPFANDLSLGNFNEGIYSVTNREGYDLLITAADYVESQSAKTIMESFDGLIFYAGNTEAQYDLLLELAGHDFPVVTLDKQLYEFPFPAVLADNFQGSFLATKHLIDLGHQKIGYIFGSQHHPQSVRQRYLGYVEALQKKHAAFRTKLDEPNAQIPTAIEYIRNNQLTAAVCENDLVAIDLMRCLKKANFRLPQDFSVVGFDDIQAANLVDPPLTTITQDFEVLGKLAGEHILALIHKKPVKTIKIPVNLVKRQSTAEKEN